MVDRKAHPSLLYLHQDWTLSVISSGSLITGAQNGLITVLFAEVVFFICFLILIYFYEKWLGLG